MICGRRLRELSRIYVVLPGVPNATIKFLPPHLDRLAIPFSGAIKLAA